MEIKFKKIVTLVLIITFIFSPIFARKAEAQWVDWANLIPNVGSAISTWWSGFIKTALDAAAYQMINLVIEKMTASTVKWINTGFKGSPAFVTDPEAYFKDMGDKIAGQYIFSNPKLNFLCGPISAKIKLALTQSYNDERQWNCTLTDVAGNMEDFMGNFEKGGWDKFFELTQRTQNNPIGAFLQAESELNAQIATRKGTKQKELDWGKGFMSFEVCGPEGRDTDGTCIGSASIATPGSVIQDKLNSALNIGDNRISVANSINQMISSLMQQLVSRIIGGIGNGLRGLSKPDSTTTGSPVFTSQLGSSATDDQVNTYFAETQSSTEKLGSETPDFNKCRENPDDKECKSPGSSGSSGSGTGNPNQNQPQCTERPIDRDCDGMTQDQLNQAVQNIQERINPNLTCGDIIPTMDCEPTGIN